MMFQEIFGLVQDWKYTNVTINNLYKEKQSTKTKQEICKLQQQLDNIEFKLELPYKLLKLIAFSNTEAIIATVDYAGDDINIVLKDKEDRYNNCYLNLSTCNQYDLDQAYELVESIKQRRIKAEQLFKLKQQALAKLTKEEKEVLGLN